MTWYSRRFVGLRNDFVSLMKGKKGRSVGFEV